MSTQRPLNITLLAGGISAEREVSLMTGAQIAEALGKAGHNVFVSDVGPDNLSALDHRPVDLVFPALHGTFGEDGQIQAILEERGLPYVGCGPACSRLSMDKVATKECLAKHCVPTPEWQVVYANKFKDNWTPATGIGYPCVVKPIADGSSVGCKVCKTLEEARAHLNETLPRYGAMLVERFVDGYELTVGLIDGQTLPIIWIKPSVQFYDYQAKYFRDDTQYEFNLPFDLTTIDAINAAALATWRNVGARHLSRVDVMLEKETLEPYVLEINTMPGFTGHSLVPKAAAKAGIDFVTLCDKLARMALRDSRAQAA